MQFNSFVFCAFLAFFFLGWPAVQGRTTSRFIYLISFSLLFYGYWNWHCVFLLIGVGVANWLAGWALERWPRHGRAMVAAAVTLDLLLLGLFKYLGFLTVNFNRLAGPLGIELPLIQLLLPLGISFYTFMALSYILDIRRGRLQPTHNLLHFLAYLSLFPQLLAGPITRARDLLPQLLAIKPPDAAQRWLGISLITHGLFKKMVLADWIAPTVNQAFGTAPPEPSAMYWWLIVALYSMQIYCDFSGYSDIAIGVGHWMGLRLADNFRHPYSALGIGDFWSRWHISLTSFLRDYLFTPLANRWSRAWLPRTRKASRREIIRAASAGSYLAAIVTYVLCGLWHGAGWTFVIWGGLHALYLVFERWSGWNHRLLRLPLGRVWAWGVTLLLVSLAWVFFRAESTGQAAAILGQLFSFGQLHPSSISLISKVALLALACGIAQEAYLSGGLAQRLRFTARHQAWLEPACMALVLALSVFLRGPSNQFVYIQF